MRPVVGLVADRNQEFVIDEHPGQVEAEVPPGNGMNHLHAGADAAVDLGVGIEVDLALTELLVVLGHLDQPLGQVLNADLGDRVAIALHRQRPIGLERHGAHHRPHTATGVGQHIAVIVAIDEDHFLSLHCLWSEEVEVDAEGLVPDLREDVFVLAEFAVDPLALDDRAGVILDRGAELGEAALS